MKIEHTEIIKEILNNNLYYKVIITVEGYDYYCIWAEKPDEKEIMQCFKECFLDNKTWLAYYNY